MNATEKYLYVGMENAGYSLKDIEKMKEIVATVKKEECAEVASANLDSNVVNVRIGEERFHFFPTEEETHDTTKVLLHLDNDRDNYFTIQDKGEELLNADDYDFKVMIKQFNYPLETIDWDNVQFDFVRDHLASMI